LSFSVTWALKGVLVSWLLEPLHKPCFIYTGMPEMLKPTSLIMGAGLGLDVACLTDGRFSGGCVTIFPNDFVEPTFHRSHGFCIGHVVPEAQVGGPIGLVQDGDMISVDAVKNTIELHVSPKELEERRSSWVAPPLKVSQGTLFKYVKTVTDASHGCVTDS
jgi:dihydroxy-acid dehydratase